MPTSPAHAPENAPKTIMVSVPQESGEIIINTFDRPKPYRFSVVGGVIEVTAQSDADLLLQRVDGASLTS